MFFKGELNTVVRKVPRLHPRAFLATREASTRPAMLSNDDFRALVAARPAAAAAAAATATTAAAAAAAAAPPPSMPVPPPP
eukprot:scaffold68277_cov41-Phaeocystis_antarctica.AAC.1